MWEITFVFEDRASYSYREDFDGDDVPTDYLEVGTFQGDDLRDKSRSTFGLIEVLEQSDVGSLLHNLHGEIREVRVSKVEPEET